MPERIEATVRRVRFHNRETGFTVLTARRDDTREDVTIVGAFPLFDADEAIVASGDWRDDRKYGRQFVAESVSLVVPTSRDGIRRYLQNDYDKNVFNGDVGVVADIDPVTQTFTVDFGADAIVDYTFDEADQLTLAYATTIHKSQGSEYRAVILALLPQHTIMLQRNLLYTAVTRGKEVVILVGDRASLDRAVRTSRGGERVTRLADLLRRDRSVRRRAAAIPPAAPDLPR